MAKRQTSSSSSLIGDRPAIARLAFVVVGDLIAAARPHVAVETVDRYVELAVAEPLRKRFVPFERLRKRLHPLELARPARPKREVVALGLLVEFGARVRLRRQTPAAAGSGGSPQRAPRWRSRHSVIDLRGPHGHACRIIQRLEMLAVLVLAALIAPAQTGLATIQYNAAAAELCDPGGARHDAISRISAAGSWWSTFGRRGATSAPRR